MIWIAALVSLLQSPPQDAAAQATELEEVVVVGSRDGVPPPPYDVLADFRTYCWDPNRLQGQARDPADDSLWVSLDPTESARLGISPAGRGYKLETERISLILTVNEGPGTGGRRLNTCTVTAVGAHDQDDLENDLRRLMGGGGSSRHLTNAPKIFPAIAGWRQIAWSAVPSKRDTEWRVFHPHPESFVIVLDPSFYTRHRWVVTELKTRVQDGAPVSSITLTHFFN